MLDLILEHFYIEVTRRCNMKCNHCLRGQAENIDLEIEDINKLFDNLNIKNINTLTITGGEPTLNPKAILLILKKIISKGIIVDNFNMVINGSNYNQILIDGLNEFYKYCKGVNLICSRDQYHRQPKEDVLKKYKRLPYFICNYVELSNQEIIQIGRARENKLGTKESYNDTIKKFNYCKQNNYPITYDIDNNIKLKQLYLSSKGLYSFHIIDIPFKQIDGLCIYNINEVKNKLTKTNKVKFFK